MCLRLVCRLASWRTQLPPKFLLDLFWVGITHRFQINRQYQLIQFTLLNMMDLQREGDGYFKSINEFEFDLRILNQGLLGIGNFGTIRLALHKGTNKMYAVKIIQLAKFNNENELKLMKRQIAIHSQLDHPHIIKLWSAFYQEQKICMIMEYAQNNSLASYLSDKETLSEPQAFKYFYQCIKAVEYLHKCDVLHRDLKTQNLLLDQNYNVKVCDFGWSTTDLKMLRNTQCGSFEHMAPEMINRLSYDYKVDIWGLGVILYQMMHGNQPFQGSNEEQIKEKMMSPIRFNSRISSHLRQLLQKLLTIDASNRPTLKQIFEHEWVQKMKTLINSNLKKQSDLNPTYLNEKINRMIQPTHKKTQSTNLNRKESNGNININFMINNFSSKKSFDKQPTEQLKTKMLNGYKTFTENSKQIGVNRYDKANLFGSFPKQTEYAKMMSRIKSSQDFNLKDTSKKLSRRKSQETVIGNDQLAKTQAVRTVTETNQKKRTSKKKKTYDDLTSLLKKAGSGVDLFSRKLKFA